MRILYLAFAIMSLINGAWMLVSPDTWYTDLPAAVADTGAYNGHLIRDLGVVFVFIACGFAWCAWQPDHSRPVLIVITAFFVAHAILHVLDLLSGRLPHSHWKLDTPAVFLPAIFLVAITILTSRKSNR